MLDESEFRIGFFVAETFQRAMLAPIYEELRHEFPCLLTDDVDQVIEFQPRILLVATEYYQPFRERLRDTIIIWTRHGFASKNSTKRGVRGCDFACLSSEWVRDDFIRRGWYPRLGFWITGFVPMDRVLQGDPDDGIKHVPDTLQADQPVLLYAPTWNRNLSAVEVLGSGWIGQLQRQIPDLQVLIKPHPRMSESHPRAIRSWREIARSDPRVALVENVNASVYDLFAIADVLLTDVSSVMFYYLALDRPIVLVNNPRRLDERKYYDPDGYEWAWRDMGIEIESAEDLPQAVARCLEHPSDQASTRALYRKRVFGAHLRGQAVKTIAQKVRALIHPTGTDKAWVEVSWNSVTAMGDLEAHRQTHTSLSFMRWIRNYLGRSPRTRNIIRRILFRYPRLHSATYQLADRIFGQNTAGSGQTDRPAKGPQAQ